MDIIEKPAFQLLQAKNRFPFTSLDPVECTLCKSRTETRLLFMEGRFPIVECRRCSLIYVAVHPSTDELQQYYRSFFSDADDADPSSWNHRYSFEQVERLLERFVSPDERQGLLDIGSGYGYMLERAIGQGWIRIVANEMDSTLAEGLMKRLPQITLLSRPFERCELPEKSFNAILMLASLEHFMRPNEILATCRRLLKPTGVIIIRVPWYGFFFRLNYVLGRSLVEFGAPRHLYDFSPKTLTKMLNDCGFIVREMLPGAAERSKNAGLAIITRAIKTCSMAVWHLSGRHIILPINGSIVAVASPRSTDDIDENKSGAIKTILE